MAAASKSKQWADEEDSSTPPSSPPATAIARRSKFEDEEDNSDVVEDWDAASDSEEEAEKAKKAAAIKAKADAEAAAAKKSKSERIAAKKAEKARRLEEESSSEEEDEDEAARRARLLKTEQDSDLKHAEDLFGDIGVPKARSTSKAVVEADPSKPGETVDLSKLALFNPVTKDQFARLRETLAPIMTANAKKAQYVLFMQEFTKALVKDLPSEQIKKISSGLTTLGNEKMKEEKALEKGGRKSKAAKTKTTLAASRNISTKADTTSYADEGFDDDDFM